MATTLLFALEIKFVLKIERNAREFALRKWLEHSRSGEKHEMESSVSLYTSFVLWPLPAFLRALQQNGAQSRLLYL